MKRIIFLFGLFILSFLSQGQTIYSLTYLDSTSSRINVRIKPSKLFRTPVSFVMPRSVPGSYGITLYDVFISNLYAITLSGERVAMVKDDNNAPRWNYTVPGVVLSEMEYEVDLRKMEGKLAPSDASIIRAGFAGILNYSVFGWIEGTEYEPVRCEIRTFNHWPIFTTNEPALKLPIGTLRFETENYFTLADGQIFMGPHTRVKEYKGRIPLFIAAYAQVGEEYLDDYGKQGMMSLDILQDYFGELPFKQYTILLRKALPLEPGSVPAFGMEHLQSSTFFGDTSSFRAHAMSQQELTRTIPTYLHHMGHAFIPLRLYGDTYLPHVTEIPPIISNIWFNEGFMWFLPYDTLHSEAMKKRFYTSVFQTTPEIKRMSLTQLSQAASTMYSTDFRLGKSIYGRGALMAIEMNNYLKTESGGKKSMKDILQYLYHWAKENKRPFTMDEFPMLIHKACGIDLDKMYNKWQLPIN